MIFRLSVWLGGCCLSLSIVLPSLAQSTDPPQLNISPASLDPSFEGHIPDVIAQQRHFLSSQRGEIMQAYNTQQAACWQKFAVNACLIEARRVRRQALDPLAKQELMLNAQEREWRSRQREIRLEGKQPDGRVAP